jgi:hypothetical protein
MSKFIGLAAGLVASLVMTTTALAASATSPSGLVQTLDVEHTPTKPGAASDFLLEFSLSRAGGGRAAALTKVDAHIYDRWGWNWAKFPKCDPAKLQAQGTKACPKGSKVGTGSVKVDATPIVANPVSAKVTAFNGKRVDGKRTFLMYNVPEIGSPVLVTGTETRRDFIEFPVPLVPTLPGQANAVVTSFTLKAGGRITRTKRVNGKRRKVRIAYFHNPKSCRPGGWPWQFDFSYENGEKLKIRDAVSCGK